MAEVTIPKQVLSDIMNVSGETLFRLRQISNTGALMATSKFVLKTIRGISRPAICTALPGIHDHTHMLDLGANLECEAENLAEFALMGSVLAQSVEGIPNPTVGLLNIGVVACVLTLLCFFFVDFVP